jgi:hypothetical protein
MKCHNIREMLALDPTIADTDVQTYVDTCAGCARYRRQHQIIDVVLRAELLWEAPETLTAQPPARTAGRATCGTERAMARIGRR